MEVDDVGSPVVDDVELVDEVDDVDVVVVVGGLGGVMNGQSQYVVVVDVLVVIGALVVVEDVDVDVVGLHPDSGIHFLVAAFHTLRQLARPANVPYKGAVVDVEVDVVVDPEPDPPVQSPDGGPSNV